MWQQELYFILFSVSSHQTKLQFDFTLHRFRINIIMICIKWITSGTVQSLHPLDLFSHTHGLTSWRHVCSLYPSTLSVMVSLKIGLVKNASNSTASISPTCFQDNVVPLFYSTCPPLQLSSFCVLLIIFFFAESNGSSCTVDHFPPSLWSPPHLERPRPPPPISVQPFPTTATHGHRARGAGPLWHPGPRAVTGGVCRRRHWTRGEAVVPRRNGWPRRPWPARWWICLPPPNQAFFCKVGDLPEEEGGVWVSGWTDIANFNYQICFNMFPQKSWCFLGKRFFP